MLSQRILARFPLRSLTLPQEVRHLSTSFQHPLFSQPTSLPSRVGKSSLLQAGVLPISTSFAVSHFSTEKEQSLDEAEESKTDTVQDVASEEGKELQEEKQKDVKPTPLKLRLPEGNGVSDILEWFKQEGDLIKSGELVCEIDTEQFSYDFASPVTGFLARIIHNKGATGITGGRSIAYLAESKSDITEIAKLADSKYHPIVSEENKPSSDAKASNEGEELGEEDEIIDIDSAHGFLRKIELDSNSSLVQYEAAFKSDGFNSLATILTLNEEDLRELGVRKGHRRLILKAISAHLESQSPPTSD